MNLKSLFKLKDPTGTTGSSVTQVGITSVDVQALNPDSRQQKETYHQWGSRMCGKVAASDVALRGYLQTVFFDIKKVQSQNDALQRKLKQDIELQVTQNQAEQSVKSNKIRACNDAIASHHKDLEDYKEKKQRIEEGKEEVNKEERIKMIIGLFIIIPLTIYLFVFYSSAFYSAFFKDFHKVEGLSSAMFDSNAIPSAFNDGFMEAVFILFAPILFLGLGFILHFFSKETGKIKYLKMGGILLVTIAFDVIIAYQIGKHIYDNWVLSQLGEFPEFGIKMAYTDPNFWAVIFCGFIAYIIWGLVFNLVISAYNNLDLSKSRLKNIENEIAALRNKIQNLKNDESKLQSELNDLKKQENNLTSQLGNIVLYSIADIKQEMNNFYTGWLNNMSAQGRTIQQQQTAQKIYQDTMNQLF